MRVPMKKINNFVVGWDRLGGKMTFVKNSEEGE